MSLVLRYCVSQLLIHELDRFDLGPNQAQRSDFQAQPMSVAATESREGSDCMYWQVANFSVCGS